MAGHYKSILILTISCLLLAACNNVKHLPKNEVLYTGASVTIKGPDIKSKEKKVLRSDLAGLARPKPNTKILGFRVKLAVYNAFRKKKEKSLFGKLRRNFGEAPVLLSAVDLEKNDKVLTSFLENRGFFHAKIAPDTVVKRQRGKATYDVETGPQYTIASVQFDKDSIDLTKAIAQTTATTLLKKDAPFNLDLIKAERNRIDANLKESGFYYFSPDMLLVKVDSTIGNNKVNLFVTVKPETPNDAKEIYFIDSIYIYSGYNLNSAATDTTKDRGLKQFEGYTIVDRRNRYKSKLFKESMQFQRGDIYNRTEHNLTLNRLINLNLFKFVKNRFEQSGRPDSSMLNTYYYLTPLPRQSLRTEITGTTKSNNATGSEITFSWSNRNTLRAGALLRLSAYIGSEIQGGGSLQGYNTYRTGAEANFTMPRILLPFFKMRIAGAYAPRTNIQLGYDVLNRRKLYTLNSFRAGYGYLWKKNITTSNEFYPVSITYVQPLNVTKEYIDSTEKYPTLARTVERQFILGTSYQFNYNGLLKQPQKINTFFLNGLLDLSGNVAGLITGANIKKIDTVKIFNLPFSQYIKTEFDGRYYRKIGLSGTWANRAVIGYGLPYGNSSQLPYIKQFFVGGANSLRGFRSRTLGPGTFRDTKANRKFYPDQTGDIKLEFNTEYRQKISGPLYGAAFIDAGNVWLKNSDTSRPGAKFSSTFLRELAVDAGLGLRVDITLFVIRLDVAVPLRKPWVDPANVIGDIRFREKTYRQENVVYNIAIGYPF